MTHSKRSLPVALHVEGRLCLVVGSGSSARDRTRTLLACGARVRLVSAEPDAETHELVTAEAVELRARGYEPADLADCWLAVLTDSDPTLARRIGADADALRVFFCAVDLPDDNSFSHMAIARAASLFVAIGSEGATPSLSRRLREELDRLMRESNLAAFVERLAALRASLPRGSRAEAMNQAVRDVHIAGKIELPDLPDPSDTDPSKP
jgi:precorrin-2 dehydrogenase/sirohydrochlorin ferrochelatase